MSDKEKIERLKKLVDIVRDEYPLASSMRFRFFEAADLLEYVLEPKGRYKALADKVESALRGEKWIDNTDYDPR